MCAAISAEEKNEIIKQINIHKEQHIFFTTIDYGRLARASLAGSLLTSRSRGVYCWFAVLPTPAH